MKTVSLEKTDLGTCVEQAQDGRVAVMRKRKPVVLIGVEGLDREQLELGSSDKFWRLVEERRNQKTITHRELERRLRRSSRGKSP